MAWWEDPPTSATNPPPWKPREARTARPMARDPEIPPTFTAAQWAYVRSQAKPMLLKANSLGLWAGFLLGVVVMLCLAGLILS